MLFASCRQSDTAQKSGVQREVIQVVATAGHYKESPGCCNSRNPLEEFSPGDLPRLEDHLRAVDFRY
jgi:hypothetical protein